MITLTRKATSETITLSDRLAWTDELNWSPVQQTVKHSVTGAMLMFVNTKQAGRPITLDGFETVALLSRAVCETLDLWASKAGELFTLSLRAKEWTVLFNQKAGAFDAKEVFTPLLNDEYSKHEVRQDLMYLPVLRFITAPADAQQPEEPTNTTPQTWGQEDW